jgi:hypothetical protein
LRLVEPSSSASQSSGMCLSFFPSFTLLSFHSFHSQPRSGRESDALGGVFQKREHGRLHLLREYGCLEFPGIYPEYIAPRWQPESPYLVSHVLEKWLPDNFTHRQVIVIMIRYNNMYFYALTSGHCISAGLAWRALVKGQCASGSSS